VASSRDLPHSLDRTQLIAAPLPEVFAFFSGPRNLGRITPPWLRPRISGPTAGGLREGSRIEYRIRWALFTLRWITRITLWQPESEFRDLQEKGPYRSWSHTHRFEPDGDGVRMRDRVEYRLPLGPLGRMIHAAIVRRQLEGIFDYRRRAIEALFSERREPDRGQVLK